MKIDFKAKVNAKLNSLSKYFYRIKNCKINELGTIRSVCFHAVKTEDVGSCSLPSNYEIHIDDLKLFTEYLLSKDYEFILPSDIKNSLNEKKKYIIVSFDDGYSSVLKAVNLYKRLGLKLTVFICPYYIINQKVFWDTFYLRELEKLPEKRKKILSEEYGKMRCYSHSERIQFIEKNLSDTSFKPTDDSDRPLSFDDINKYLLKDYVEIGNHTMFHTGLTNLSIKEVNIELDLSQKTIFDNLAIIPTSFSFPFGYYNEELVQICFNKGFKHIFTTENIIQKIHELSNKDKQIIGRFPQWGGKKNPFISDQDKKIYFSKIRGFIK